MNKFLFILAGLIFISCNFNNNNNPLKYESPKNKSLKIKVEPFIKELPEELLENSGMILYDSLIWTFNDSGGKNKIYGFNFSGKIKKEIEIEDAENRDWEDIAQDKKYIYIGDFGNNSGRRNEFTIYRIKKKDISNKKKQKLESKEIKFTYSLKDKDKTPKRNHPYDCEAITEFNNDLYIFSKDRSDLTTAVYQIPTKKGNYKLKPQENFDVNCLVTGVDISPDNKQLAIIGYNNWMPVLWLFSDIEEDGFFAGNGKRFELKSIQNAQTEGVCFLGNDSLLISCEQNSFFKPQVFVIDLKTLL